MKTIEQAKMEIGMIRAKGGEDVYGKVMMILGQVAEEHGVNKSNGIIDSLKLTKKMNIQKMKE